MPTNVKTSLAYCDQCKVGIGWGAIKQDPRIGHVVSGKLHTASFVEIDPSEAVAKDEAYDAFLARMVKKYVK